MGRFARTNVVIESVDPKTHTVTFQGQDPYVARRRVEKALENLEPEKIVAWFPDVRRCFQCSRG